MIPQFKLTDRQEWALVESARDRYKDEWRHLARHLEHDKADEAGGDDDDDESLKTIVGDQLKINKQTLTIMAHHNYIYRMLEKVGFTRQLIETIMYETLSKSVGDCLDWALMFLDPQQIPSGFTDKHMHYDPKGSLTLVNNNGEAAAVATVSSSTSTSSLDFKSNPPPNNRQQQASSSSSSSMKMAGKSNVDSIDAKLKSWILNQAESVRS